MHPPSPSVKYHGDYIETDVFIAGSGPIGATYALKCVNAGLRVLMVEIGAADSLTSKPEKKYESDFNVSDKAMRSVQFKPGFVTVPGYHKKNQIEYQKDIDRFVNVIKGALSTVSIPSSNLHIPTLDPSSYQNTHDHPFMSLGKNPAQNSFSNLGAEAVTRGVGGMTTHWTCATPELFSSYKRDEHSERPRLMEDNDGDKSEWARLYDEARRLIGTSEKEFDKSIRHTLVLKTLQDAFKDPETKEPQRVFKPLPLACHRLTDPDYVEWHATDRILEELFTDPKKRTLFTLLTNHRCTKVVVREPIQSPYEVVAAEVMSLLPHYESPTNSKGGNTTFYVRAKAFVIAAGAVGTPQILANSHRLRGAGHNSVNDLPNEIIETPLMPNLGKYITEQPMTFCQIVLNADLVNSVPNNPYGLDWWEKKVKVHREKNPNDPISIPYRDPEPQVTTPFSPIHPWHTQIHRDAFSYGAVAETIDTRVIVDLRFFGYVEPCKDNEIVFQKRYEDAYGMPQPTFKFTMGPDDRKRANDMMKDMCNVALALGGYLPGSEPQFMTPGLALHLAGTVRAGLKEDESVADTYCKVWKFTNLYVGGNGVIPTGFAANPTLTSICYAIRSAEAIIEKLTKEPLADK